MKFLICPATPDLIEAAGIDTFFQSPSGIAFNYSVDYTEDDMILISDVLGRAVPLDISEIGGLISVLMRIDNFQKDKDYCYEFLANQLVSGSEA